MTARTAFPRTGAALATAARPREAMLALGVLAAAVAFRLGMMDAPPIYDELYHVLAARSWIEDGSFRILDGSYDRAPLYTMLVGLVFQATGETGVAVARLPSVLTGALLSVAVFLWARHVIGAMAGWIAAGFAVLWPSGIMISQFTRFYALHGLLFFAGAVAVYAAARREIAPRRRLVLLGAAALAFLLAAQFQITTYIGVLALALWAGLFVALPAAWSSGRGWHLLGLAAALVGLAVAIAWASGVLGELWTTYRHQPWSTDPFVYHRALRDFYPTFWPLYPVAALIALRGFPRPAAFCFTLFTACLLIHSFAGIKNIRYIYYVTPFFFLIWAAALQTVLPPLGRLLEARAAEVASALFATAGRRAVSWTARGAVAAIAIFVVLANPAAQRSFVLAAGGLAAPSHEREAWSEAREALEPWLERDALVVATNELYAIEYVGGFDLVLSNNRFREWGDEEFVEDPRTGRPLFSRPSSLERVVRCHPLGVFLADADWWEPPRAFQVFAAFEDSGAQLSVWRTRELTMIGWESPATGAGADCAGLPDLAR